MAQLGQTFDANGVAPAEAFETIPAGKYLAHITESEMRPTKDGAGQYLWLKLTIIDGQYTNRVLFDRLNLVNNNAQAAEIAQRTLSAICHATGKMQIADSEQVHFIPMQITVKVRPAQGNYQAQNEIGGYASTGSAAPVVQTAHRSAPSAPVTVVSSAKPAVATAPWRRTA